MRILLLSLVLLASCAPESTNNAVTMESEMKAATGWTYRESVDQMRKERSFIGELISSNEPDLEFPYQGGSPIILQLAKFQGDTYPDNYQPRLILTNGQYDCSSYSSSNSCLITVKADDQKPYELHAVNDDCGSVKCLILNNEAHGPLAGKSVIEMLRTAKHLTIEVPLYGFGNYQYEFNTAGLKWSKDTTRQ